MSRLMLEVHPHFLVTLTLERYPWSGNKPQATVSFYDSRYPHVEVPHAHGRKGQFVSSYSLETMLTRPKGSGLVLHGGVPSWIVPGVGMEQVYRWLLETCGQIIEQGA